SFHFQRLLLSFPTRRSSDLGDEVALLDDIPDRDTDRGHGARRLGEHGDLHLHRLEDHQRVAFGNYVTLSHDDLEHGRYHLRTYVDRKSTRLNSSHVKISYAV